MNQNTIEPSPLFSLDQLVATPSALAALKKCGVTPMQLVARNARGDWGNVCSDDAQTNTQALQSGARLLSSYTLPDGVRIWIITEADRSSTTLLLPSEN
jgi:hypothetical protein